MRTIGLPTDADRTGRDIGEDELALLREVIDSGTLDCTRGTRVKVFECAFAAHHGISHARAVSYDPADHPGTMQGLERVVVLPWNERYTNEHVDGIAAAVRAAVSGLIRRRAVA
jgi:dTDP-4-amino-4,6-dideoxygalactose transaminase